jgi:hypothetical protein
MLGKNASAVILGLIALCAGCTLPCHPYDYCGPIHDGSGQYCSNVRAGSILADGDMESSSPTADQDVIEENVSNVERGRANVEQYEGVKQILSVTDRKVDESEGLANSQSESNRSRSYLAQPAPVRRR